MNPSKLNTVNLPSGYSTNSSATYSSSLSPFSGLPSELNERIFDYSKQIEPQDNTGYYALCEAFDDMKVPVSNHQQHLTRTTLHNLSPDADYNIRFTEPLSASHEFMVSKYAPYVASPTEQDPNVPLTPDAMRAFANVHFDKQSKTLLNLVMTSGIRFPLNTLIGLKESDSPELQRSGEDGMTHSVQSGFLNMNELLKLSNSRYATETVNKAIQTYINTGLQQNTLSSKDCFDIILSKKSSENQIGWANHNLRKHISEGLVNRDGEMVFNILNHTSKNPKGERKPSSLSSLMAKIFIHEIPRIQDTDLLNIIARMTMHKQLSSAARSQLVALR